MFEPTVGIQLCGDVINVAVKEFNVPQAAVLTPPAVIFCVEVVSDAANANEHVPNTKTPHTKPVNAITWRLPPRRLAAPHSLLPVSIDGYPVITSCTFATDAADTFDEEKSGLAAPVPSSVPVISPKETFDPSINVTLYDFDAQPTAEVIGAVVTLYPGIDAEYETL
jgi:hypothetical protein